MIPDDPTLSPPLRDATLPERSFPLALLQPLAFWHTTLSLSLLVAANNSFLLELVSPRRRDSLTLSKGIFWTVDFVPASQSPMTFASHTSPSPSPSRPARWISLCLLLLLLQKELGRAGQERRGEEALSSKVFTYILSLSLSLSLSLLEGAADWVGVW